MISQVHPLHVKVKQNDINIPILLYKFSVSTTRVIHLFILKVYFCNVLDCSDGLTSQCKGHTIR